MAVTAVKEYVGDRTHGRRTTSSTAPNSLYIGWDDHLMFCAPFAFPLPAGHAVRGHHRSRAARVRSAHHPDFAKIDWSTVEWTKSAASRSTRTRPSRSPTTACGTRTASRSGPRASPASRDRSQLRRCIVTYELTIEPLGQTVEVEEGQTLLDASLRAGVYLPHACGHGLCGTCKVQVLDGEIDHGEASSFALMDFEREEGLCLACCATAESDVTIEADIDEEPDALNLPVRDGHRHRQPHREPDADHQGRVRDRSTTRRACRSRPASTSTSSCPTATATGRSRSPTRRRNPHEIELDVRLVPGGAATTWIHEQLAVGDQLRLSGPYGRFFVRSSAEHADVVPRRRLGPVQPPLDDPRSAGAGLRRCRSRWSTARATATSCTTSTSSRRSPREYPNFTYVPALSNEPRRQRLDRCPRASSTTPPRRTSTATSAATRRTCAGRRR